VRARTSPMPRPLAAVKIYPELSIAALRSKKDRELCLWYELRALNLMGDGNVDRGWAVATLVAQGRYSRRTLYRILALGEGDFWLTRTSRKRSRLFLRSLHQVAICLNVVRLSRNPQVIPASEFMGRAKRRAWLYASFFPPEDSNSAKPISRESIAEATGVQRRQQIRYDSKVNMRKVPNFGVHDTHVPGTSNPERLPLRQCVSGKSKEWWITRRLGNTCWNTATTARRGMVRKVKRLMAHGLEMGARPTAPRRFFTTARAFLRCPLRHEEPFLRVPQGQTFVRGRSEWCLTADVFAI